MSEAFLAEIRIFPYNYAPVGWAFCNGQLIPIAQNTALFSLLGTTYGGDGKTTFGLPNLGGRAVLAPGQGPGLSSYVLGESGGSPTVTLTVPQMAVHQHAMRAHAQDPGDLNSPGDLNALARSSGGAAYGPAGALQPMAAETAPVVGGNAPHNNMQPYLAMNYCICMSGIFPPRG